MRLHFFTLSLILAALMLSGCTKPWTNPDIPNKHQSEAQFESDSVKCQVISGEEYPLDKHKQEALYNSCMIDKGWIKRDGSGIPIKTKSK